MTTTAFQRLLRVLSLEEKQGWRNRAVIGGMAAMAERWQKDAEREAEDPRVVRAAAILMNDYQDADPETRPDVAIAIRNALSGDLEIIKPILTKVDEEPHALGEEVEQEQGAYVEVNVPPPEPTNVAQARVRRRHVSASRSPHDLQASPDIISGVGGTTTEQLARLGIHQVVDLLWNLPPRYEDYSKLRTIAQLTPGEQVTIVANLWEVRERKVSMNRQMVQGILADGTGTLHATWWNKYVKKQLKPGALMRFSGKVGLFLGQKTLENPAFEDLDEDMVATGRIAPVYRLTEGISNKRMRGLVRVVLDDYGDYLTDPLPEEVRADYDLPDLISAVRQAHFPDDQESLQAALRRLAFEEFFYIQLGVMQRRRVMQQAASIPLPADERQIRRFLNALSFALTGAQSRVLDEVLSDMRRTIPMTRLLQGDVGSGKTAIAAGAMFVASNSGAQSALLAPTQILAEQHHRSVSALLGALTREDGAPIMVELLTGGVGVAERSRIAAGLRSGEIDIVVGTTALIQETVDFNNLGLAVVDEQHRFGVEQRGALRSKGAPQPHLLVMSATPIPRSLALTVYGELDVSIIDELPPGRQPVKTKWFRPGERERLYNFLRREAQSGRQGFVVYPLVEESERVDAGAAVEEFGRLQTEVFPDLRLALLHGRMSGDEKDGVMSGFVRGEYDALVSTTVIEVGIDVPNASLMIVEDAERFGLAQLHQLRGRVGRGGHPAYCALISSAAEGEAKERLQALEQTNSGFDLAEKDLELRGPGDFFGKRQSGLPDLRVAHLGDMKTLVMAREAAQSLSEQDAELEQYPHLARQVQRFWRGQGDVS